MEQGIDHDTLDAALRQCGASWDAAQTHGLLSGCLSIAGTESGFAWLSQVLQDTDEGSTMRNECEVMLSTLFETTYRQLADRQSEFVPLLPDEQDSTADRTAALARWCEGFLHGLVSSEHGDVLKEQLSADPLADIIKDMLQITRATVDEECDEQTNENAYAELVEYLRVAAQLTFEELAEFRRSTDCGEQPDIDTEVLH